MSEKNSRQTALPMGTTPAPSDRVAVTLDRDVADMVAAYVGLRGAGSFNEALELLLYLACDAVDLARKTLPDATPKAEAVAAVEAPKPPRTNDALIGEIAARIAEHTIGCGAGFWTGGAPEARAVLGIKAHGHTIAAAFQRIEHGKVAGVSATLCGGSHRARGTFALWTVAVASKTHAT